MKGTSVDRDKTRVSVMCECGGFFITNECWYPDDDMPNLIRNSMFCDDCDIQICLEILDHGATSVEIHSITPNQDDI